MSTRVKFLALLFLTFSGVALSLTMFLRTDYARMEMAYFRDYPYQEMASRELRLPEQRSPPSLTVLVAADPSPDNFIETGTRRYALDFFLPGSANAAQPMSEAIRPALAQEPPENRIIIQNRPKSQETSEKTDQQRSRPPAKWRHAAKLGYEAYARGDHQEAIIYFERALKFNPDHRDIRLQLAYAYKVSGRNKEAAKAFKLVIDQYDTAPFGLRREVEQLENRFEVAGYFIYRAESAETRRVSGPDLTQSQAGLEASYQPEDIGFNNGRKLQLYGRLLAGMEQDNLEVNPDSFQAGIGLRTKPISTQNLVLSLERLVKVGDFARNDWMIRAGYSYDHGTDYREGTPGWISYSLYLDAALIRPSDPDIYLTGQFTGGYNLNISNGFILQPRLTGLVTWQKDRFREASLIEAGPGVNLRYYFNETKYEAYRSYIDLTVEYRIKISGNSTGGSGPVIGLIFHL